MTSHTTLQSTRVGHDIGQLVNISIEKIVWDLVRTGQVRGNSDTVTTVVFLADNALVRVQILEHRVKTLVVVIVWILVRTGHVDGKAVIVFVFLVVLEEC